MNSDTLISLMHMTARVPDGWQTACRLFQAKAANYDNRIQYVLGVHARQSELPGSENLPIGWWADVGEELHEIWPNSFLSVNPDRPCIVDNANSAIQLCLGDIIVSVTDDLRPCDDWDVKIREAIPDPSKEVVLAIGHGYPQPHIKATVEGIEYDREIVTHGIATKVYTDRLGYCGWPEYIDYGCDDDFTLQACKFGVIVDRPDIVFPHRHWSVGQRNIDELDRHNGRPEVWARKAEILERRIKEGFPTLGANR